MVKGLYHGDLCKRKYGQVLIGNACNKSFCRFSYIFVVMLQNSILRKSLRGTPDRQNVRLRTPEKTHFDRRWSDGFVTTAEFDFLRCGLDQLHGALCSADRRRPALAFLQRNLLFVKVFRLQIPGHQRELYLY